MESLPTTAIETTGTVDEHGQLRLDAPLPLAGESRVRILVLSSGAELDDDEISEEQWLKMAAASLKDYLNDSREDIYTLEDGKPFIDED